jgi:hypothetical protein
MANLVSIGTHFHQVSSSKRSVSIGLYHYDHGGYLEILLAGQEERGEI